MAITYLPRSAVLTTQTTAVTPQVSPFTRAQLEKLGYDVELVERTYNPTTAIWFDPEHGVMHGAASDYGDDYGIAC